LLVLVGLIDGQASEREEVRGREMDRSSMHLAADERPRLPFSNEQLKNYVQNCWSTFTFYNTKTRGKADLLLYYDKEK